MNATQILLVILLFIDLTDFFGPSETLVIGRKTKIGSNIWLGHQQQRGKEGKGTRRVNFLMPVDELDFARRSGQKTLMFFEELCREAFFFSTACICNITNLLPKLNN